jgi:chromosome segregation ATPase
METVVFDTTSGISLEEQKEILAGINAMSGGSRLIPEAAVTETKKKGFLFPLFVNIGAFAFLALGFVLLSRLHVNDEQQIRDSSAVLGLIERKLIQEIRQETDRLIREKESQINDVLAKLNAVDSEFRDLQFSVEDMTDSQKQRAASLLILQEEYQRTLSGLEEEMAAMEELNQLGTEQDRVKRIEAQMSGFYMTVNDHVSNHRLTEASATLKAMKDYLAASALLSFSAQEARRQTHLTAIAAMEKVISLGGAYADTLVSDDTGDNSDLDAGVQAEVVIDELKAQIAALEQKAANLERDIVAFGSQGSEQAKRIAEYTAAIRELEAAGAEQQQTLDRRNSDIQTLRAEINQRERQVSELNSNSTALQSLYDNAQRRMEAAIRAYNEE